MILDLRELTPQDKARYLQHVIVPRPICLASTIDTEGNVNLSPFSFFNLFSTNPPVVIFSPSRRVRDNTTKHTLENVHEVPEVVINIVTFDMVHQVSLASSDYPKGTDEFLKAGFTKIPATRVSPPMVKESLVQMECHVQKIQPLGFTGGSGQLVVCEILVLHINAGLFDGRGNFRQERLEAVARLGGNWYCRVGADNLFTVDKPGLPPGMGLDNLPEFIRTSNILSGSDLAQLASFAAVPEDDRKIQSNVRSWYEGVMDERSLQTKMSTHEAAKLLISMGKIDWAWEMLLMGE